MLLENNPYPLDVRVRSEAESLALAGHRVVVVAPRAGGQRRRERVADVEVERFWLPDASGRGPVGFVVEYIVAAVALHVAAVGWLVRGATVLHLHNPPDVFFGAGLLYRLAGRKVVFDHHDLFPETVEVKFGSRAAAWVARVCERLTYAVADHVIATNASYADVAAERGHKRPGDVTVVRNGPPAGWRQLPSQPRAGALRDVRLAYLGAISSQDGVEGLIPVLARLRERWSGLEPSLTVIGDGDARPAIERALATRGLSSSVAFTGRVAPETVPGLLARADICVDPAPATDVNQRSTMTKIAEYLALGKPVVAYDLLETRRTAGAAARLVAPGNVDAFARAIGEIANDPVLRGRLSEEARRRAADLTWDHSARALLHVYDRLREPPRGHGAGR